MFARLSAHAGLHWGSIGALEAAGGERWHRDCDDRARPAPPRAIRSAAHAEDNEMATRVGTIRRKIDAGMLPCEPPEKMVGAPSDGGLCAACDAPIAPTEIALTFWSKTVQTHRFHLMCHRLWEMECRRRGWQIRA